PCGDGWHRGRERLPRTSRWPGHAARSFTMPEQAAGRQEDEMPKREGEKFLTVAERKAIFLALVEAQDAGMGVGWSRKEVTRRFGVGDRQVRRIEEEGIDREWPPLGE